MVRAKIFFSALMAFLIMTVSYAIAGTDHTGVVVESETSGGYTYLQVNENGNKFWVAGPETVVSKGARVSFSEQIWMNNFKSKALNRTFDKILFVNGFESASSKTNSATATKKSKSAKPAKAYTIEQIYANSADLSGKLVRVRGNVVKVSENIMDRTWVHIKDGTGTEGSNKLVFRTTGEAPKVGAAVTAQGRLETDKDFGFGYFYAVIVEDSTFSK